MSNTSNVGLIKNILLTGTMLGSLVMMSGNVFAQAQCGAERDVKQGLLDEATWKRMNTAYELVGEEQYDEAYEQLIYIRNRAKDDYLKAVAAQAIAQVEWARGNFDLALKEFETAVALDSLPDRTHYSLMYQIAQLYYMKERYDDSLEALDLWFCKVPVEQHKATAYVLKAQIFAQKEDWANVVPPLDSAIAMDPNAKENWYALKLAAHFQLDQYPEAAETLEVMISKWPEKKVYWVQLSNTYFKLENDDKALSVIALAYRKDLLDKQSDILYLANLYSFRDVPYKAASVMQKGIEDGVVEPTEKHWTITGDNWYAAEEYEYSLAAFQEAGKAAMDGKIDLRRGYILVDMERWDDAAEALGAAIEKGGLSENQTGEAYLMLGMTEFSRGNYDRASTNWGRAGRYPKQKKSADQWMNHMREERARKQASL